MELSRFIICTLAIKTGIDMYRENHDWLCALCFGIALGVIN